MLACRGCCCGTDAKHPDVDHDAHLARLRRAAEEAGARLWTVDCLGPCERSNVVVVRSGAQRRWFGGLLSDDAVASVASWVETGATGPVPRSAAPFAFSPDDTDMPVVPWTGAVADLVAWIVAAPDAEVGAITMGTHGAVAEVPLVGATVEVDDGTQVTVRHDEGRVVVDLGASEVELWAVAPMEGASMALIAVCLPTPDPAPGEAVRDLGPDTEACELVDRADRLFDLGIGHAAARFCVRSSAADVAALVDREIGRPGLDALEACGRDLAALSPARVVLTPVGRAEVTAPIPGPDGRSPDGAHTHVVLEDLALGVTTPPGITLPGGLLPAALLYLPTDARP